MALISIERLNNSNKADFHDYCWLYASDLDQSFFPLTEDFEINEKRPGFLFYENGQLQGVICVILDESFTVNSKGRIMVFHSRKKAVQIYRMLLEAVLPFIERRNVKTLFAFLPDDDRTQKQMYKNLGFYESRKTLYLKRTSKKACTEQIRKRQYRLKDFKPSEDMSLWCHIINVAYKDIPGHIPYTHEMVREDIETDGTFPGCARILYVDEKPVGLYYCSLEARDELWISQLAVLPQYRSKGLGRMMLHECLYLAQEFDAHCAFSVNIENIAGISLFKSEGFKLKKTYTAFVYKMQEIEQQ